MTTIFIVILLEILIYLSVYCIYFLFNSIKEMIKSKDKSPLTFLILPFFILMFPLPLLLIIMAIEELTQVFKW